MKKLLITGISGFLGSYLAELNPEGWEMYGLYNRNPVRHPNLITIKTNLSKPIEINKIFQKIKPDALIHLAALSNPNYCETNQEASKQINVEATIQLAKLCQKAAIPFLFSSTDLVFNGENGPYNEHAVPDPISVYGKHKAFAEKSILALYREACIVRFPVMYGMPKWGNSFMSGWLNNLKEGKTVFAFTDEYRTKVDGHSAVKGLMLLLNKKAQGIWHLGGRERMSRFEFAIKMAQVFQLPVDLVKSSLQADVSMNASRPADVSLDSSKAFEFDFYPEGTDEALRKCLIKRK